MKIITEDFNNLSLYVPSVKRLENTTYIFHIRLYSVDVRPLNIQDG